MKPCGPGAKSASGAPASRGFGVLSDVFAALFGALLGLALLKFGNPPIMEKWVTVPTQFLEYVLFTPWPIAWAYPLLGLVTVAGLAVARWDLKKVDWLLALIPVWLAWQFVSATHTLSSELTEPTVKHFVACAVCFSLGFFSLSRVPRLTFFWAGLVSAFLLVLVVGWEQHFGGLEDTRQYFFEHIYPTLKGVPPEFIKKMSSTRIFGTLFYPNSLAGALLLLLPITLALIAEARGRFTPAARWFLALAVSAGALACLYWSGSKGGWLLMLVLGLLTLLRLPFHKRLKLMIIGAVLLVGLAGFFYKYSGFFRRGATSVSARFDYWRAAVQTAWANPLFGTGPGTFLIPYQKLKQPESELTRLVHNDYLQQASDAGLPAFLAYTLFVAAALLRTRPRARVDANAAAGAQDWLRFAVWLGVLGWAMQGLMEFGLYLPALSWPAFTFLGYLLAISPALPRKDTAPGSRTLQ
jgi:O-antigen ligase